MQERLLQWICCPLCKSTLQLKNSLTLRCQGCHQEYSIVEGIPWLLDPEFVQKKNKKVWDTACRYEFLWKKSRHGYESRGPRHIERMHSLLGGEFFQGEIGLDAGAGMGDDTEYLAQRFSQLQVISLDLSLGVNLIRQRLQHYPNVHIIRASVLQLPLRDQLVDFVYSYGVLHHTPEPERGFAELTRVTKPKGAVILYLYEDHADRPVKKKAIQLISILRKGTVAFPPLILYALCWLASPFIVIFFSWPAKILRQFQSTRGVAEKIPFNFARGLWSVTGDLYDRFATPEEWRFSENTVRLWYHKAQFDSIVVTRFQDIAGLVSIGRRQ